MIIGTISRSAAHKLVILNALAQKALHREPSGDIDALLLGKGGFWKTFEDGTERGW